MFAYTPDSEIAVLIDWLTSRETEHSALTRAWLAERGYPTGG